MLQRGTVTGPSRLSQSGCCFELNGVQTNDIVTHDIADDIARPAPRHGPARPDRLAPAEVRDDAIVQATRPPASPPPLAPPVAVVRPARPLAARRRPANRRHRAANRAAIRPPRPSRPVPPRGTSPTPGTGDPVREQRGRLARPRCYN